MLFAKAGKRSNVMAVAILSLVLLLLLVAVSMAVTQYRDYDAELERLAPRIAKLEGIKKAQSRILEAETDMEAQLSRLVYPAELELTVVQANLQQEIRAIAAAAEVNVVGTQILNTPGARQDKGRAAVKLSARGSVNEVERLLDGIKASEPMLLIDRMEIKPERVRRGDLSQNILMELVVVAFKAST